MDGYNGIRERAGMAAGFQICKNLDIEYLNAKEDSTVRSMIKKAADNML